jgi:hypothetical protein
MTAAVNVCILRSDALYLGRFVPMLGKRMLSFPCIVEIEAAGLLETAHITLHSAASQKVAVCTVLFPANV